MKILFQDKPQDVFSREHGRHYLKESVDSMGTQVIKNTDLHKSFTFSLTFHSWPLPPGVTAGSPKKSRSTWRQRWDLPLLMNKFLPDGWRSCKTPGLSVMVWSISTGITGGAAAGIVGKQDGIVTAIHPEKWLSCLKEAVLIFKTVYT